jgi:AcrR family transcriptional regulator
LSQPENPSELAATRRAHQPISRAKRRILEGAIRLFREHGYHGTTIRDIGRAVGLTSAALYRHFANKDEVLETAIWETMRKVDRASREVIAEEGRPPEQTLAALVRVLARTLLEDRDRLAVYLFEARHLDPRVYAVMQRAERRLYERWLGHLLRARPELSETRARTLAKAAVFMIGYAAVADSELDREQLASLLSEAALASMLHSNRSAGPADETGETR